MAVDRKDRIPRKNISRIPPSLANKNLTPWVDPMVLNKTMAPPEEFCFEFKKKRRCEPDTIPAYVLRRIKDLVEFMDLLPDLEAKEFCLRESEDSIYEACNLYRTVMPLGWKYERKNARKILEEYVFTYREEGHTWISKVPQPDKFAKRSSASGSEVTQPAIPYILYLRLKEAVEIMSRPESEFNITDLVKAEKRIAFVCHFLSFIMPVGWTYDRETATSIVLMYHKIYEEDGFDWISTSQHNKFAKRADSKGAKRSASSSQVVQPVIPFMLYLGVKEAVDIMNRRPRGHKENQADLVVAESKIDSACRSYHSVLPEEFFDKFQDWLDVTRQLMDDPYSLDKSGTEYNEVAKLLLEDKNKLIELISLMVYRASGGKMLKEDGTPDESAIDRFFERIDVDDDGFVSRSELKNFIMEMNYEEILMEDEIAEIIMRHLDVDGSGHIDKHEFKSGVTKWLKEIERVAICNEKKLSRDSNREKDNYQRAEAKANAEEKYKAIILLLVGIFMLTVLAEPLVESVIAFSKSVKIESFYVSFILVPFATNARTAIAAIRAASQKRHQTTSLTFSEIYHKVFMNNVLGFSVLVSVIYFRGLTWHFSAEIFVVIIVCFIMGILASVRSKFPNWTLLIAFPLYPLSLVMVYLVDDSFRSA